ncbi:hypothetical protein [Nocardioides sp. Leaf307]|uniref:hypothetical protein n=1 Tax=Nocardioides sp. Leaf307 TaxID=1736331 RepID=UPI00070352E7|nr:hypothetical protein [Nocardioides sp. Leaf307]KQQ41787.1 hypothetical protein ASF50_12800 [Nocardioides sp. Leaf307]
MSDTTPLPGLVGALQELIIDYGVIEGILDELSTGEGDLSSTDLDWAAGSSFGSLPRGTELSGHADKAKDYLRDSLVDLRQAMNIYIEAVQTFRDGTNTTDTHSAEALAQIQSSTDAVEAINQNLENR